MSLSNYRRHGAGMRIAYSIVASPIGRVLVAATRDGVCAVKIGDSDAALVRDLEREYAAAEIIADEQPRREWVKAIADHLRGVVADAEEVADVAVHPDRRLVLEVAHLEVDVFLR